MINLAWVCSTKLRIVSYVVCEYVVCECVHAMPVCIYATYLERHVSILSSLPTEFRQAHIHKHTKMHTKNTHHHTQNFRKR
jgi:hypothetical protein